MNLKSRSNPDEKTLHIKEASNILTSIAITVLEAEIKELSFRRSKFCTNGQFSAHIKYLSVRELSYFKKKYKENLNEFLFRSKESCEIEWRVKLLQKTINTRRINEPSIVNRAILIAAMICSLLVIDSNILNSTIDAPELSQNINTEKDFGIFKDIYPDLKVVPVGNLEPVKSINENLIAKAEITILEKRDLDDKEIFSILKIASNRYGIEKTKLRIVKINYDDRIYLMLVQDQDNFLLGNPDGYKIVGWRKGSQPIPLSFKVLQN